MNDTLEHHGILGMKWGVRRYQNKDGTWTKEGKEHRTETEEMPAKSASDIVEVKANSVFTKDELDAVKNNEVDDPELMELMLMEVVDATGYSDGEFEFETSWEDELEKFKKDPHNYTFRFKGYDYETHHSDDSFEEDSLMHYGILGMKWGIRRYQNKDGSLTAAGRKRYGDDIPDGNKSSDNSTSATPRTPAKSASEMTDQELNQALNRLRMEQQYNELTGAKSSNQYQNQQNFSTLPSNTGNLSNAELQAYITRLDMEKRYAQLTAPPPKQLTNGQKFLKEVIPAVAMEVGRELVKSTMKKMLGLSGDNNENKNNNNNNNNKNKNENNNDALNKLRGRLDESDKRMNLIKNSIESLDKNMKTLSNKSNEDRKQTESIQKDFLDFMKKNAQQIQQEEKKNNDALRAEWKSNAGSQKSNWSYSSGSDDYSYYENPWTYRVNRA